MVAIAHSVLNDRHLAEDATQHGFAQACIHLPELKKKDKFGCWLRIICKNAAKSMAIKNNRLKYGQSFSTIAAKPKQNDHDYPELNQAIAKLKQADKELVFLRFYSEKSYDQISNVLGISRQTISGRLRRIKKKIAIHLNGSLTEAIK